MGDRVQTKVLDGSTTSVTFVGDTGNVVIEGDFTGPATVTQSLPGTSVAAATFTAEDSFFINANTMTFGISGGVGPITISWFPVRSVY